MTLNSSNSESNQYFGAIYKLRPKFGDKEGLEVKTYMTSIIIDPNVLFLCY